MVQSADLGTAVTVALRAPSVHNTQPWRWRIRTDSVELYADWTRHLPWTDPDRRDLVLSCGAALHHLRVALAAQGAAARVDRLPDPDNAGHLATVTLIPGDPDLAAASLLPAIERRRTERRQMSHRPVPAGLIRSCAAHARSEGADLLAVTSPAMRQRLAVAMARAAAEQNVAPGYSAELQIWTRRYAGSRDGVGAQSVAVPQVGLVGTSPLRQFPRAELSQPTHTGPASTTNDAAELLVLTTTDDDELAWLRAGEATSAVLLTATNAGLATTPLSQAVERDSSRRELRAEVLHALAHPQLIIRLGWPAEHAEELPVTPRRDLHSVLLPR